MAGQTFTATTYNDQPRNLSDGINIATAKYVALTTSLSVSDVIQMIRLPEGAVIVDGYISGKVSSTTALATICKVGIGVAAATDDDLMALATLSSTSKVMRFDAPIPYATPAIAAATYPKYNWLTVTCISASTTASVSIQVCVTYLTGGLTGL